MKKSRSGIAGRSSHLTDGAVRFIDLKRKTNRHQITKEFSSFEVLKKKRKGEKDFVRFDFRSSFSWQKEKETTKYRSVIISARPYNDRAGRLLANHQDFMQIVSTRETQDAHFHQLTITSFP